METTSSPLKVGLSALWALAGGDGIGHQSHDLGKAGAGASQGLILAGFLHGKTLPTLALRGQE
jgi:hypothetical protein